MRQGRSSLARALASSAVLGAVSSASGFDSRVDADFAAQLYDVSNSLSGPRLTRRRFTQTVSLDMYDLQGDVVEDAPRLHANVRLRLDADTGIDRTEFTPARTDRFVPGVQEAPLDLMVGYVEGRGFGRGLFSFRLGRQYRMDPLGFWSFDGGLMELATPAYFALTVLGGFEQRGGPRTVSTSRYEADGVYRGNRDGLQPNQRSDFLQSSRVAPAWGLEARSTGVSWLQVTTSYRKVYNRDSVVVSPFVNQDGELIRLTQTRTSTERAGGALMLSDPGLGSAQARSVYDIYLQRITTAALSLDWFTAPNVTLGANYDYFAPSYDADSIFNWFVTEPMQSTSLRADWSARWFSLSVAPGFIRYGTNADADSGDAQAQALYDATGRVDARYLPSPVWVLGSQLTGQAGQRGHSVGGSVEAVRQFDNGHYEALLRASLYDWSDSLQPNRDATSFTYVVGAALRPFSAARAGVEWEHSMNRLVDHRLRFLATLQVSLR